MLSVFQATDYSLVLGEFLNNNLDQIIGKYGRFKNKSPVFLNKPKNDEDLQNFVSSQNSENLFEEDSTECLICLDELEINKKNLNLFLDLQNLSAPIVAYFLERKAKAEEKKLLTGIKLKVQELKKPDPDLLMNLGKKYLQQIGNPDLISQLNWLIQNCQSYQQFFDEIDFLDLSSNAKKARDILEAKNQPQLFTKPFRVERIREDKHQWLEVTGDDLQLALALILTKLEKQPGTKKLIQSLINLDQAIKLDSNFPQLLKYKLWLWNLGSKRTF